MYSSAYVWAKVFNHMEERLGAVTISAWFDDAEVVELNDEQLILYSASDYRRDIIRSRCTEGNFPIQRQAGGLWRPGAGGLQVQR